MSPKGVFIWGSCVSRDTFEHVDPTDYRLECYVARQSAVSAISRPVNLIEAPTFDSRFQQRMVSGDFASSLERDLAERSDNADLILIDLVDERLGFYVLPDDSVITRSVEFIRSGGEGSLPAGSRHVPFGSREHFDRWTHAIGLVSDLIHREVPNAEVVLLDIPWAALSSTGEPTPASFGVNAKQANKDFRRYVRAAQSALGARTVTLPASTVTSGPTHPWGESPFHYAEDVYLRIVQEVTAQPGRAVWAQGAAEQQPQRVGETKSSNGDVAKTRPGNPRLTRKLLAKPSAQHGWSIGHHTVGRPQVVGAGRAALTIGRYCWFEPRCRLVLVERRTDAVSLYSFRTVQRHWPNGAQHKPEVSAAAIEIGHDVRLGEGAEIRPGVRIGSGAYIGRHAVVTEDIPPYAIVEGVPGKVVAFRFSPDQIEELLRIAWWDWPDAKVDAALPLMVEGVDAFLDSLPSRGTT